MDELAVYKKALDAEIERFCKATLDDAARYTPYSREAADALCHILRRGGKRLRGALVMNAYEMVGGKDRQVGVRAGLAMELLHAYLLIIDDICDRSAMRRGGPSAHVALADYHQKHKLHGDGAHFGVSVAMNAAMLGAHLAQLEVMGLPVDEATKLAVLQDVNKTLVRTIHGQFNDLFNEALQDVSQDQVMQVLTWKTAYYSFLSPIVVGMRLAGVGDVPTAIEEYARNLGLAFQIIDDVLGTFGDEFESGKSAKDDLREGKVTLMVAYALERASAADKKTLLRWLGNDALTDEGLEECKKIIQGCGALVYTKGLAKEYAAKAMKALDGVPQGWKSESVLFMRGLAQFVVDRDS